MTMREHDRTRAARDIDTDTIITIVSENSALLLLLLLLLLLVCSEQYCALTFEPKTKESKRKQRQRKERLQGRTELEVVKQTGDNRGGGGVLSCAYTPGAHSVCVCVTERQVAESGSRGQEAASRGKK